VNISSYFAVVVGLSIFASMLLASIIGTVTPLVMRRMNIDPAITSGPFVTTATDIIGVTTYLLIAALLLPH
jgi:magnesium transporter